MDENATPAGPHSRFPRGPALLCVACLAMATWTWVRYSYTWDTNWDDFRRRTDWFAHPFLGRYVKLRMEKGGRWGRPGRAVVLDNIWNQLEEPEEDYIVPIAGLPEGDLPAIIRGRVLVTNLAGSVSVGGPGIICIDTAASRFHGASIAGLVVGAMGMFVFGLYLRSYARERRTAFTAEAQRSQRTT